MNFTATRLTLCFTTLLVITSISNATASDWTGSYYGFTAGLASSTADHGTHIIDGSYFTANVDGPQMNPLLGEDVDATGLAAGLFAGMNMQSDNLVYGVEADLTFTDFNEQQKVTDVVYNSAPATTFSFTTNVKSSLAASIRGRLGMVSDKSLYYVTAGLSMRKFSYDFLFTDTFQPQLVSLSDEGWKQGISFGLGLDHKLEGEWTLKVEFMQTNYADVVDATSTTLGVPDDGFIHKLDFTEQALRVGMFKKF